MGILKQKLAPARLFTLWLTIACGSIIAFATAMWLTLQQIEAGGSYNRGVVTLVVSLLIGYASSMLAITADGRKRSTN